MIIQNNKTSLNDFQQSTNIFAGLAYDIRESRSAYFFLLQTDDGVVYSVFYNRPLAIKDYDRVEVKGRTTSEETISAFEVHKVDSEPYNYPFCELNIHTKMSTFNSIIDPEALFERLSRQEVKYAGFTDIHTVSNFPKIEELAKKHNIKPIYGCELAVFDDKYEIFSHIDNRDCLLKDLNFIVLDIETNGLNKYCDDIIEIAWVGLKNGFLSDTYSALIKSDIPIKKFVSDLTGITNATLEHGKSAEEVFKHVVEVFKDKRNVFVSQNRFDLSMLRHKIRNVLNQDFLPSFMDSKDMFRVCFPDEKVLSVGELARSLSINMERQHRALDDAMATARILKIAMDRNAMWQKSTKDSFPTAVKHLVDSNVVVWAKNKKGLKAIYKLISVANENYFHRYPRVPRSLIDELRADLILGSPILRGGEIFERFFFDFEDLDTYMHRYDYLLLTPKVYVSNAFAEDPESNKKAADMVHEAILKNYSHLIIATSSPMFLLPEEEKIAQAITFFGTMRSKSIQNRHLRNMLEMEDAFNELSDDIRKLILVDNIDQLISQIDFDFSLAEKYVSLNIDNACIDLKDAVDKALKKKYPNVVSSLVNERIANELLLIAKFGFSDIYLIVAELLDEVKKKFNIMVGSRGTIGSSLVAFLLDITQVNALPPHQWCIICGKFKIFYDKYSGFDLENKTCCGKRMNCDGQNIAFSTFAGLDGSKIPDIDLNVPTLSHAEIMKFIDDFFINQGLKTSRSGTFITLQRKNAFAYMRRFCTNNNITLTHAYMELCSYKAIGCKMAYGQHPGGIMIFPRGKEITDYTPIQTTTDEHKKMTVTQFDNHFLGEQIFKLDILAHDDPTTLQSLCSELNIDVDAIPMNDIKVLSLFQSTTMLHAPENKDIASIIGDEVNIGTLGIPEFGTVFVRRMLKRCRINSFADIVRVSGFAHGRNVWTNNAERLLTARTQVLSELIACRDDIFDFLSRYNLDAKDNFKIMEFVRKGKVMSDKDVWRSLCVLMQQSNVPQWFIDSCSKINYLFPRAHACAYVIMAFRIAYFKLYYPINFYNAFLNRKLKFINDDILFLPIEELKERSNALINAFENDDKNVLQLYEIIHEMRLRGVEIAAIDISLSDDIYFIVHDGKIIPPLSSIKGLGDKASASIKSARAKSEFKTMADFRQRTKINDSQIKLLQKKGILKLKDIIQTRLF